MTPEDCRAVEAAARRIVAYGRWRERNGRGGRAFPDPAIEVLEAHVGGFTLRTVKLAKHALKRAGEIEGREVYGSPRAFPDGVPPPQYGSRHGGGVFTNL